MFAWILTILSAVTGAVWLLDKFWLSKQRRAQGGAEAEGKPGVIVDFCVSFFPVIFAVFMIRSFLVEPFRIPSGSMIPTLHVGDFILVNKFEYGLRCPVGYCKFVEIGEPKRGDVVVFKFPRDPSTDFIKRLVGLPGDHIHYENKVLTVNGETVKLEADGVYVGEGVRQLLHEDFLGVKHDIILDPDRASQAVDFDVPPGQYFMMGDNRDGSFDSRYWGTVPEANLKGRAILIWMSWNADRFRPELSRIGMRIH